MSAPGCSWMSLSRFFHTVSSEIAKQECRAHSRSPVPLASKFLFYFIFFFVCSCKKRDAILFVVWRTIFFHQNIRTLSPIRLGSFTCVPLRKMLWWLGLICVVLFSYLLIVYGFVLSTGRRVSPRFVTPQLCRERASAQETRWFACDDEGNKVAAIETQFANSQCKSQADGQTGHQGRPRPANPPRHDRNPGTGTPADLSPYNLGLVVRFRPSGAHDVLSFSIIPAVYGREPSCWTWPGVGWVRLLGSRLDPNLEGSSFPLPRLLLPSMLLFSVLPKPTPSYFPPIFFIWFSGGV